MCWPAQLHNLSGVVCALLGYDRTIVDGFVVDFQVKTFRGSDSRRSSFSLQENEVKESFNQ